MQDKVNLSYCLIIIEMYKEKTFSSSTKMQFMFKHLDLTAEHS